MNPETPTEKISENIFKIKADSNCYLVKGNNSEGYFIIDTGRRSNQEIVKKEIEKITSLEKIKKVIFTHLHYDHIGNFDIFTNAKFYASKEELACLKNDPYGTILNPEIQKIFNIKISPLENLEGYDLIPTPGHTKGCFCLLKLDENILFSGDTLFFKGLYGRTDLPTSIPEKMKSSLEKLDKINYSVLCPGHEY